MNKTGRWWDRQVIMRVTWRLMAHMLPIAVVLATIFSGSATVQAEGGKRPGSPESPESQGQVGPKVVLELFTSQGCSSCPPADKLMRELIARDDVIGLSLAIDYWDYLGWRDTFGQRLFTARQQDYGRRIGDGMVYTPQLVVDGRAHLNGADKPKILAAIKRRKRELAATPPVKLSIKTRNDMLHVSVGADPHWRGRGHKITLWLALFSSKEKVQIKRGENRGHYLSYHNVVRELTPIGRWAGEKLLVKLPKTQIMQRGADGCVVLLQEDTGGPILAATQMASW